MPTYDIGITDPRRHPPREYHITLQAFDPREAIRAFKTSYVGHYGEEPPSALLGMSWGYDPLARSEVKLASTTSRLPCPNPEAHVPGLAGR